MLAAFAVAALAVAVFGRRFIRAIAGATALLERVGLGAPGAERGIGIISRQNHHLSHIRQRLAGPRV